MGKGPSYLVLTCLECKNDYRGDHVCLKTQGKAPSTRAAKANAIAIDKAIGEETYKKIKQQQKFEKRMLEIEKAKEKKKGKAKEAARQEPAGVVHQRAEEKNAKHTYKQKYKTK